MRTKASSGAAPRSAVWGMVGDMVGDMVRGMVRGMMRGMVRGMGHGMLHSVLHGMLRGMFHAVCCVLCCMTCCTAVRQGVARRSFEDTSSSDDELRYGGLDGKTDFAGHRCRAEVADLAVLLLTPQFSIITA